MKKLLPIIDQAGSDSAMFDNALELLVLSGRSLPHAVMMMIPEPWSGDESMSAEKKAFYEYHSCLMEPWDGPASIAFTDGVRIGAVLDRNGLRPSRYYVTKDDLVIMASEVGVLEIDAGARPVKGRLQPGRMFLVDLEQGRIIADEELKRKIASEQPYGEWLRENLVSLEDLPPGPRLHEPDHATVLLRQRAFGYTTEDLQILMAPMAAEGNEAVGSMGNDAALAVLSDKPQLLYNYFKQLFAQVTNPPVDGIREEIIMSMETTIGAEYNLLEPTPRSARQIKVKSPIIDNDELDKVRRLDGKGPGGFKSTTLSILYPVEDGAAGLERALDEVCRQASAAVADGCDFIILSDRGVDRDLAPIPALLATAGVHHHLIRKGERTKVGLVLESGEPREVHHFALLIGYGAGAINPYLAFETLDDMIRQGDPAEGGPRQGRQELRQGGRQGRRQGDVQDGHLDRPELLRRPDLRGGRPEPAGHRQVFHLDRLSNLRRRPRRDRRRRQGAARSGLPRPAAQRPHAGGRRPVPVPQGRRIPPFQPRNGPQAAIRLPQRRLQGLQAVQRAGRRPVAAALHAARPVRAEVRRDADPDRGGGAGRGDHEAVQVRRHVLRLDQPGGARDAGHRHEPHRRQEQHRRGRRGPGPLHAGAERRLARTAPSSRWRPAGSA